MTHRNAPLTPEGRRRAVEEVLDRGRPVSEASRVSCRSYAGASSRLRVA